MTPTERDVLALVAVLAPTARQPELDDTFIGLGYTSVRFLELSIAVEHAFGLPPLTPESLARVSTVADLVDLVEDLREAE